MLIADSDRFARIGLRVVLQARPEWMVCAEAETGDEAVVLARATRPDVALLGLNLLPSGLVIARVIREAHPSVQTILLAARASPRLVHDIRRAGADALVRRSDPEDALVRAVEHAHQRLRPAPGQAASPQPEMAGETLSPRELEVAALVASGYSTKEIAAILGVTGKSADTYRTRLMRKLGAHSVVDVVRFAIRHGLVDIE